MIKEYSGLLFGGPDDGNHVEASTNEIPVTSTTELQLDGKGVDKAVSIVVVKGSYIWSEESRLFIWTEESNNIFKKRLEAA